MTPTTRTLQLEVILPVTVAPVLEMLRAMATCLEKDIPRYKKAHKTDDDDPAVKDKAWAVFYIRDAIKNIQSANKRHWNKE